MCTGRRLLTIPDMGEGQANITYIMSYNDITYIMSYNDGDLHGNETAKSLAADGV